MNQLNNLENFIKEIIQNNDVVLFMKGNKENPTCGFSKKAVEILNIIGVTFKSIDVLASNEIRDSIKKFSNWPTIPQLYIKKEFIGGCDIMYEMFKNGDLKQIFIDKKINLLK